VVTAEDRSKLLTLRTLLELVADTDRRVELSIETKHPNRYAGLVERTLVDLLQHFGWARNRDTPVRMMSFSLLAVRRMRQLAPAVPRVFLMRRVPLALRDGSLPPGVQIAGAKVDILRHHPEYAERLREHGHRLHVWTVDRMEDVDACVAAGVEAIITNRPAEVLTRLGR
jgi:glycerophosphoryl diester phosphodiesterase